MHEKNIKVATSWKKIRYGTHLHEVLQIAIFLGASCVDRLHISVAYLVEQLLSSAIILMIIVCCSFIDLPNLSSSIYSSELCNRLRAFLTACPPPGPSPPVAELVIATSDFQRDLASWKIR